MAKRGRGDWIILRTGGKSTLPLSRSLTEAGFDVWTPIERRSRRLPRKRDREEVELALMPSFVFARCHHTHDLLALSRSNMPYRIWDSDLRRMIMKGHPHFSLFRQDGAVPTIPDAALTPIRAAEARTAPKAVVEAFGLGEVLKLTEGGFAGLVGTVNGARGQFTMVAFDGFPMPVQIATALLREMLDNDPQIKLKSVNPEQGAAKAA